MKQKDIDKYLDFVNELNEKEKIDHKRYLRDLQEGKILGPMTGYSSIDEPWLKITNEEADRDKIVSKTMWQVLRDNSKKFENKNALYYNGTYVTYGDLIRKCEHFARSFTNMGIKANDHVVLCMANTPEFVYAFYGLLKIGAIPNLIEPRTNAKRILGYVNNSKAKYMVMVDKCYKNIEKMANESTLEKIISISPSVSLPKNKKMIYDFFHRKVKTHGKYIDYEDFENFDNGKYVDDYPYIPDRTSVVVYTSGTSGVPKGVELRNETYNGQNLQIKYSGFSPKPGEIFLGNVPFFSAYGSSSGMHNALCYGVMIYLIPSPKIKKFPNYIRQSKCTFVMGSPKHFEELDRYYTNHPEEKLNYVKCFVSGGDKILEPHEIHMNKTFKRAGGSNVKKGLGSTENGGGFTTTSCDLDNKIGSVGIPLAQNIVRMVDPVTREEIPYGQGLVGEIEVASITHANGYLNNSEQTEKAFYQKNGKVWFRTADMGYMDSDGVTFFSTRRSHAIMRPDGHTTPLLPIENAVAGSKYIYQCGAVGVKPDENSAGELPMLFVKLNDGVNTFDALRDIRKILCDNIPPRERPKWIRIISEIPYTLMEKVDYLELNKIAKEIGRLNESVVDCREKEKSKIFKKIRK